MNGRVARVVPCGFCGEPFHPWAGSKRRFCSKSCASKGQSRPVLATRPCEVCGADFHPRPNRVAAGGGRWCSVRCYGDRHGTEIERLWRNVRKSVGCWEWLASVNHGGYGIFKFNGKTRIVHRIVWELENGLIPDGLFLCHHCDTPRCVRPSHLFLGTAAENMQDAVRKGRMASGERWAEARRRAPV